MSIYLYLVKTKIPTYFLKRSCGVQSLLSPPPKSHGVRKVLLGLRPNPRQGASLAPLVGSGAKPR
jgi:hypothetical protein